MLNGLRRWCGCDALPNFSGDRATATKETPNVRAAYAAARTAKGWLTKTVHDLLRTCRDFGYEKPANRPYPCRRC